MGTPDIRNAIAASVLDLSLINHPYYRAWQQGLLTMGDLGAYAAGYRQFEMALPDILRSIASQIPAGTPARRLVESNLQDEISNPCPHVELFERFANAVGAPDPEAPGAVDARSGSMDALVDLYWEATKEGTGPALAVLGAYEVQAAAIAKTKAAALVDHHGIEGPGVEFWSVHADLEESHGSWTVEALEELGADTEDVRAWSQRSARAWWDFLDEREADRAA